MNAWWFVAGAVLAGPLWLALAVWGLRVLHRKRRGESPGAQGGNTIAELAQLAGGLAHEIKNPLSTINVNLTLLAEDLARLGDDEHRRWLRRLECVQQEAERLRGILDDFLSFAGKVELSLTDLDLRKLVDELVDFFTPQARASHVLLRTALPDQPVPCRVDANLVKQALLNLMINAVQATEAGGELMIRLSATGGQAVLEVIDTGRGIPEDQLERIFQVYYSTKKNGTGLGLPTTRRIVREHGGEIQVQSQVGQGTRFAVLLPLARQ
jgi:signal transduction histidine kinase